MMRLSTQETRYSDMNNAAIFKQAHALTKATVKAGDNYQATFALCLKLVIEQNKAQAVAMVEAKEDAHMNIKAIIRTIPEAIYQVTIGVFCVGILAAHKPPQRKSPKRQSERC